MSKRKPSSFHTEGRGLDRKVIPHFAPEGRVGRHSQYVHPSRAAMHEARMLRPVKMGTQTNFSTYVNAGQVVPSLDDHYTHSDIYWKKPVLDAQMRKVPLQATDVIFVSDAEARKKKVKVVGLRWGQLEPKADLHGGVFIVQGWSQDGGLIVADVLHSGYASSKHGHVLYPQDLQKLKWARVPKHYIASTSRPKSELPDGWKRKTYKPEGTEFVKGDTEYQVHVAVIDADDSMMHQGKFKYEVHSWMTSWGEPDVEDYHGGADTKAEALELAIKAMAVVT